MSGVDEFDVQSATDSVTLKQLADLAKLLLAEQARAEQLEAELKKVNGWIHEVTTRRLPDLMSAAQTDSITTGGYALKMGTIVSGSLPKDEVRRKIAIDWLVANGGDGILKTAVTQEFGRSELEQAKELYKEMVGHGYNPKLATTAHPQTLAAFVRERLANGEDVEPEKLGVYVGKVVKVTAA